MKEATTSAISGAVAVIAALGGAFVGWYASQVQYKIHLDEKKTAIVQSLISYGGEKAGRATLASSYIRSGILEDDDQKVCKLFIESPGLGSCPPK